MIDPGWNRLKNLFATARSLDGDARERFLAGLGDRALRDEVESLLDGDGGDPVFLEPPEPQRLSATLDPDDPILPPGCMLGAYEVIELIAVGGMGAVYRARRADDAYEKQVAIKVIRPGLAGPGARQRFARERQTLASLEHRGIARLLDGGTTGEGLPYLVMELVEGEPIDAYCRQRELPVEARLELFRAVCAAVQYAQQNLVLHRDLKPANIFVTADGEVKLLDFGIAQILQPDGPAAAESTVTACRALTPEYASPEQIRGEPVTTASDVFSLGVVLYRLLAERAPFPAEGVPRYELERAICEVEPPPPSVEPAPGLRRRAVAGDLDTIVLKAMRKDPARRYASARELDEDLERCLRGRPVRARPDTMRYRVAKLVRRRKIESIAAAAMLAAIMTAVAGIGYGFLEARQAERIAQRQRDAAQEALRFYQDMLATTNPYRSREPVSMMQLLRRAEHRIETELAGRPVVEAGVRLAVGRSYVDMMMWKPAERQLGRALRLMRDGADADPVAMAECMSLLGRAMTHRGRAAAVPLLEEALVLRRAHYGPEHQQVAEVMGNLGYALWASNPRQRRFDAAERSYRAAIAMHERLGHAVSNDNARVTMSLGFMYGARGRDVEAETCYRDALEIYDALPVTEDRYEVTTLSLYAGLMERAGRYAEARDMLHRCRAALPEDLGHWDQRTTTWRLAAVEAELGRDAEAEAEYRAALALECVSAARAGADDPASLHGWAEVLRGEADGDWPEACVRVAQRFATDDEQRRMLARWLPGLAALLERRGHADASAALRLQVESLGAEREAMRPEQRRARSTL